MQALHRTTDVQQSLAGNRASKLEEELLLQPYRYSPDRLDRHRA